MNGPEGRLPAPIDQALRDASTDRVNIKTHSASDVYCYVFETGEAAFLKIQRPSWSPSLARECQAMQWLAGKVRVPEVLAYHCENDVEYLLTAGLPGQSSENEACHIDKQKLIERLAEALRTIHALPTDGCPVDKTTEALVVRGRSRIEAGIVTLEMVAEEGMNGSPTEALNNLADHAPELEGPVVTHGDYCLPNIMIEDGRVSGFIDLGYFGLGDPYRDFVAAHYSIRRNLGEEWVAPFFEALGRKPLDDQKLKWYRQIQAFD